MTASWPVSSLMGTLRPGCFFFFCFSHQGCHETVPLIQDCSNWPNTYTKCVFVSNMASHQKHFILHVVKVKTFTTVLGAWCWQKISGSHASFKMKWTDGGGTVVQWLAPSPRSKGSWPRSQAWGLSVCGLSVCECSSCACVGSHLLIQLPPTVQRHVQHMRQLLTCYVKITLFFIISYVFYIYYFDNDNV